LGNPEQEREKKPEFDWLRGGAHFIRSANSEIGVRGWIAVCRH